jgi:hypothetical protein
MRLRRAALRSRIAYPRTKDQSMAVCANVLAERHDCLQTTRLWDVLLCCRRMDKTTVHRVLAHAGVIDMYRLIGQLTDRQIDVICLVLRSPSILRSGRAA